MISEDLKRILSKTFQKSTTITSKYKKNDIVFKTDADGYAILLFIGKKTEAGTIKGERYARTLKRDSEGNILKDHWELKGKAT